MMNLSSQRRGRYYYSRFSTDWEMSLKYKKIKKSIYRVVYL